MGRSKSVNEWRQNMLWAYYPIVNNHTHYYDNEDDDNYHDYDCDNEGHNDKKLMIKGGEDYDDEF
jgi:hypothetical protein